MSAVESYLGTCSKRDKEEEDLSSNLAVLESNKKRQDLEILSRTELNANAENNTNSKRNNNIKNLPNHSPHLEKNQVFKNVISGNIPSAVISHESKTEHGSEYFDLQRQGFNFLEKIITKNFSDKKYIKILNLLGVLSHLKHHSNNKIGHFSEVISSHYQKNTSDVFKNEKTTSELHSESSRNPPSTKMSTHRNDTEKLNCGLSSINSKPKQLISALTTTTSEESGQNRQLILLCCFVTNADLIKQSSTKEDIKIVLPLTWTITVTPNVVTLTNKSNQNITIFFRNPVITKIEERHTPSPNTTKTPNIFENNKGVQNKPRNTKFLHDETSLLPNKQYFIEEKNKNFDETKNTKSQISKGKTNFFPLQDPLLLKYIDGKKTKQILMYKDNSLRALPDNVKNKKSYKTIEDLLTASNQYEGDPIHFIFDPLKVIHKLKRQRKVTGSLVHVHSSEAKHNLLKEHSNLSNPSNLTEVQNLYKLIKEKKAFITTGRISYVAYPATEYCRKKIISNSSNANNKINLQNSNFTHQTRFSPFARSNNEHLTSHDNNRQDKPQLKIRRSKNSWTSYKHVNVKKIVSSVFRDFFHYYSVLGGNLRSGSVITKSNSNFWLRVSGVITDSCTLKLATDLFTSIAGTKVVLNIYDYLKFLIAFAQRRRLIVAGLVDQMTACDRSIPLSAFEKQWTKCRRKNQSNKSTKVCERNFEIHLKCSTSLPNMRNI